VDRETREPLIERYEQGYGEVVATLEGAEDRHFDAREAPEEWSPREVVHHLGDSEMRSALRLRRLIAEDEPEIVGYDQEEYARRRHYNRPIASSLAVFRYARESTAEILRLLTEDEWLRVRISLSPGRARPDAAAPVVRPSANQSRQSMLRLHPAAPAPARSGPLAPRVGR
jgi:hypothetical protein